MKKQLFTLALAIMASALISSSANAAAIGWTNWSSDSFIFGANGSSGTGTMNFGSDTVGVSLTGLINEFIDGDGYYKKYPVTYGGLNPSDVIKERETGTVTLTFSKPVVNPYIALVSVGQNGNPVTYSFSSPFEVISHGPNDWGYGGYTIDGNNFIGTEFNGILKFNGKYSALSFGINPAENWHGFNVGASAPAPAPEPSSMILGLMSIGGILLKRKKK